MLTVFQNGAEVMIHSTTDQVVVWSYTGRRMFPENIAKVWWSGFPSGSMHISTKEVFQKRVHTSFQEVLEK